MKKLWGIELVAEEAARRVSSSILAEYASKAEATSPIEEVLYHAITVLALGSRKLQGLKLVLLPEEDPLQYDELDSWLYCCRQFHLDNFRVDFLFRVYSHLGEKASHLVVECDGHEFHERTKEQAKKDRRRDRDVQASGMMIYRFTGAEIWADPIGCAQQILDWATGASQCR